MNRVPDMQGDIRVVSSLFRRQIPRLSIVICVVQPNIYIHERFLAVIICSMPMVRPLSLLLENRVSLVESLGPALPEMRNRVEFGEIPHFLGFGDQQDRSIEQFRSPGTSLPTHWNPIEAKPGQELSIHAGWSGDRRTGFGAGNSFAK